MRKNIEIIDFIPNEDNKDLDFDSEDSPWIFPDEVEKKIGSKLIGKKIKKIVVILTAESYVVKNKFKPQYYIRIEFEDKSSMILHLMNARWWEPQINSIWMQNNVYHLCKRKYGIMARFFVWIAKVFGIEESPLSQRERLISEGFEISE